MTARDQRQIAIWLLVCCGLVFAMVVLGGVTRLTGSGLSMVNWEPVTGIVPPLNEAQWQQEFTHYQQSPEYQKINRGMDLAGFKRIFWFEFAHRVLGRAIGIVFFLPFLYFLIRRKISRSLAPKLVIMLVLGGLQGLLGWYMVKSGLIDNPHVSQYRLTAHLLAAVLIYSYMFWVALDLLKPTTVSRPETALQGLRRFAVFLTALIVVTIASGGFVAGTKAGFTYNTFPLMGGRWIPEGILSMSPAYLNFFENIATIQFEHRVLAIFSLCTAVWFWFRARSMPHSGAAVAGSHLLLVAAVGQALLGVATLLWQVPVALGATHQGGALVLLTAALYVTHGLRQPKTVEMTSRSAQKPVLALDSESRGAGISSG